MKRTWAFRAGQLTIVFLRAFVHGAGWGAGLLAGIEAVMHFFPAPHH